MSAQSKGEQVHGIAREHYEAFAGNTATHYEYSRWHESEIKRRHYAQTLKALQRAFSLVGASDHVLEVGCGPAIWTPFYLNRARAATLVDISSGFLSVARERLGAHSNVEYILADFLNWTAPAQYDVMVSIRALEYMRDKRLAARKCFDALKPGGRLVLGTKNGAWIDHQRDLRARNGTSLEQLSKDDAIQADLIDWRELSAYLSEAGFESVRAYPLVFGSYSRPARNGLGLGMLDTLSSVWGSGQMSPLVSPLVESFVVTAVRPK